MDDAVLTVTLNEIDAARLRASVDAGEYPTVDAALADALDEWSRREERKAEELAWVRAKIHASIDDPRPSMSSDEVRAHLETVMENARKRRSEAA